jgi:hypothetical protein
MSVTYNAPFFLSLPSLPGTKAEYIAMREVSAIFAAACAYAEPEIARQSALTQARRAAKRAYDEAVLFLVWPDGLCPYEVGEGRTVYAPWHKFLGVRRHVGTSYCLDWEPAPDGAVYMTAEELGFNNAELRAHAHSIALLSDTLYWMHYGGPPRELRNRVLRVREAIAGQIAAWYRRREALSAWHRLANPRA